MCRPSVVHPSSTYIHCGYSVAGHLLSLLWKYVKFPLTYNREKWKVEIIVWLLHIFYKGSSVLIFLMSFSNRMNSSH